MNGTAEDHQYMARALQWAAQVMNTTDPNPRVGCVLVRDGEVVGEGWHQRAGSDHAEVNALRQAGSQAEGATAYVTLEPCCHHGRTPPCSEALIEAGIGRLVVAMEDPNPQVAGRGAQRLREAGVEVVTGVMASQAAEVNPGFVMRMGQGRPWVRCKLAMSLDGRTAMASGESKWITTTAARADVQRLRARSSAIVTGIGTAIADHPSLTVRPEEMAGATARAVQQWGVNQPLRVVVDSQLRLPIESPLLAADGGALIVGTEGADPHKRQSLERAGAQVVTLPPGRSGRVDLHALLELLASRQVNEVLVEAGAGLSGAMLEAGLVDEVVLYMAPSILGDQARGLFSVNGIQQLADRIELAIADVRAVGDNWRITGRVRRC